jgi:hypothetical protein
VTGAARVAYLAALRGLPYDRRERHCWWLASTLQRDLFGRALPLATPDLVADPRARAAALATRPERARWHELGGPADGALVLMGRTAGRETHCGVYLAASDGGAVWHTDAPHGVVADWPLELARARHWRLTYLLPAPAPPS